MNTNVLTAGVIGFLLRGLTVWIAAEIEPDQSRPGNHSGVSDGVHSSEYEQHN